MYRQLSAMILLAVAGFSQTPPVAKPDPTTLPSKKAGRSATDDAATEKAIRARLAASKISTDKFVVHVQGGVATITGKTEVLQHKGVATRLAKSAGAKQVVNKVEVGDASKNAATANLASGARRV